MICLFSIYVAVFAMSNAGTNAFSSWTDIAPSGPSPGYVTGHAGVADHGSDAALFFAGQNGHSPSIVINDLWRFSFHGKQWEKLQSSSAAPSPRYDHCGTTCFSDVDSRALFFGGASHNGSLFNDVWALSLDVNNNWLRLDPSQHAGPGPSPRKNCACVCLAANHFVVFGGQDARGVNNEVWTMNLLSKSWNLLQPSSASPSPLFGSCMYVIGDSSVFVFGGMNSNNVASSDAWILNLNVSSDKLNDQSVSWQYLQARPGPSARAFHGCVGTSSSEAQASSVVHIRGGIGSGESRNDNILQDFWTCSLIQKDSLTALQCRPVVFASALPLCSQCISVMISNIVLVHGGLGIGAQVRGQTSLLYLSDNQVETVMHPGEAAPSARSGAIITHFVHIDSTKYIFLHAGSDSNNSLLADTWLFDLTSQRWSQVQGLSQIPPARSHGCSAMLNHLIIVYGGRCSSNLPWMFNSVSNEWSLLISAKEQNINDVPSPRWGHGCAILPTPGKDSPHALSLYVFGGVSIDSDSNFGDLWSLDLELVQSLRVETTLSEHASQILSIDSRSKQFLWFKLAPTHIHPLSPQPPSAVPRNLVEQNEPNSNFRGVFASSGFSHSFSIASWLRIFPQSGDPRTYLIFELQEPLYFSFDHAVQTPALRLYLKGSSLILVDFNWKTSCPGNSANSFRVVQSLSNISLLDGLWHHVAVTVTTDLHKIPVSKDDPDLLYLFGTEDCSGPNVTTSVGVDFCDRLDVEQMLNASGSDFVRCIYNPGPAKHIRLSRSCHSSLPTNVANNVEHSYFKTHELEGHVFDPAPDGDDQRYGSYWTIGSNQTMRLPVKHLGPQTSIPLRVNAILYCRNIEQSSFKCVDNPLRGATRRAKIYIDGIEVASASHLDRLTYSDPNPCFLTTNLRIAYPYVASYLKVGIFPDFNDNFDALNVGSIANNRLTMLVGTVSIFLSDISSHLASIVSGTLHFSDIREQGLKYYWDFSNASMLQQSSQICFRDYNRLSGSERDAIDFESFSVCAYLGSGFLTTSPYVVRDAAIQNFTSSNNLKSKGWNRERVYGSPDAPLPAQNYMVQCPDGALIYTYCSTSVCDKSLWFLSSRTNAWQLVSVVPSIAMLSLSIVSAPSFSGFTAQFQDARLFIIGGTIRTNSVVHFRSRFTVATFSFNDEKSQAIMDLFVYDEFSSVVDASSASNGTHAFVFGGKLGWGRRERVLLIFSFILMKVTKVLVAPTSPPAALFSAVVSIENKVPKSWISVDSPTKKGLIIVYGGSVSTTTAGLSRPKFAVTSAYSTFDTDLSYWRRYEPHYVTNNIFVNVNADNWISPEQRMFPLPPLTEHSMISAQTVELGLSLIIIIGGFSKYLDDGISPDPASYNNNIYFSGANGALWYVRGPRSRAMWNTDTSFVQTNWMPPRSAAAVFAYKRLETSRTIIFVHGGRRFDGVNWANGGALEDIWIFPLEECIFTTVPPQIAGYFYECEMHQISTNPPLPRYFHSIIAAPVAGQIYFILSGGFAPNGLSALQAQGGNSSFGVYFCSTNDALVASYFIAPLAFTWLPVLNGAPSFATSALSSVQYNNFMGMFFAFGGSSSDFTRSESIQSGVPAFYNNLWAFSFDPVARESQFMELKMVGKRPSHRSSGYLFTNRESVVFLGGMTRDFLIESKVFSASLVTAHPGYTTVFGDALTGGVVGSICNVFVSAQTVMFRPALACESCLTASVKGETPGTPTYNLVFEAEGVNMDSQAAIYKSSFLPLVSGIYKLSVYTLLSSVEDAMPFVQTIEVSAGPTCASISRFTNAGSAVAGSNIRFVVQCNDAFSNIRPGGDTIHASVFRLNAQKSRTSDEFSYAYTDLKSGAHELIMSITRSATYSIESKLGLRVIENKAFTFVVSPQAALCDAVKCNTFVIGVIDSMFAGQAKSMLVISFDEYFNLADPSFEKYAVTYTSTRDGSRFQDVAVSYVINSNIATYSMYFFSSSEGLLLSVFHNDTQIPSTNFISRIMEIDEVINKLETSGLGGIIGENSRGVTRSTSSSAVKIRLSDQSTESNANSSNEIRLKVQNVFKDPDSAATSLIAFCTVVFSIVTGLILGVILICRSSRASIKVAGVFSDDLSQYEDDDNSSQLPPQDCVLHNEIMDRIQTLSKDHRSRLIEEIRRLDQ